MRRGVGIGAVQQRQALAQRATAVGTALAEDRVKHVEQQVNTSLPLPLYYCLRSTLIMVS